MLRERDLLHIPLDEVYDDSKYFVHKNRVKMSPYYQPVFLGDPTGPDIPQYFDGPNLRVKEGGVQLVEDQGEAEDAMVVVPALETWRVFEVWGFLDTAAAVPVRACGVEMAFASLILAAVVDTVALATINVAANEFGSFSLGEGPNYWTNTNGVLAAVAGANPLPKTFPGGSTITMGSTNLAVGDQTTMSVLYREVT